jgi:hypothetical protein
MGLKFWRPVLVLFTFSFLIFSGCSSNKKCSADSHCKDGYYCGTDSKCVEFLSDDYTIAFEDLQDGQELSSGDDKDTSKEGIQVDVVLSLDTQTLHDGMEVALRISGSDSAEYKGVFIKKRSLFSNVTIPFGSAELEAYLVQNPEVKTKITINSKKVDIIPSYMKNGKGGTAALLDKATVFDTDDYDASTVNGIQLYLTSKTEGIPEGGKVSIFVPEVQDNELAEGTVDAQGNVDFGEVTIPIVKTVRMSFVNGSFSKSVEFTLETKSIAVFW